MPPKRKAAGASQSKAKKRAVSASSDIEQDLEAGESQEGTNFTKLMEKVITSVNDSKT